MFATFSTALSALTADSAAIDVVGNNLANLNTVGYKGTKVSFRELIAASMGAGNDVGIGVDRPQQTRVFTQGNVQSSSGLYDVAIRGAGFLVTKDSMGQTYYTRAGNLEVSKEGILQSATGDAVQGWATDPTTGQIKGNLSGLAIPVSALSEPSPTTLVSITANLDSRADGGASFKTDLPVYDSQGQAHNLLIVFTKAADPVSNPNEWSYTITVPGEDMADPAIGDVQIAAGTLNFASDGKLPAYDPNDPTSPVPDNPPEQVNIDVASAGIVLKNGATLSNLTWNTRDANHDGLLTQFAQTSALSANSQDGQAPGQVLGFSIEDGGLVVAKVSNGPQRVVGVLALASIQNPETLEAVGDNKYQLTDSTALPAVGTANTGGRGQIASKSLESSTVDIAGEFTNLIVFQRGYQANAKIVTTLDELSQDTINLKR